MEGTLKSKGCGWSTLHYAAANNHPEIVKYFIDRGANKDSFRKYSLTLEFVNHIKSIAFGTCTKTQ